MGPQSVEKLCQILRQDESGIFLRELRLINLTGLTQSLRKILTQAICQSKTLIKLKLSYLDLCDSSVVNELAAMITDSQSLNSLDFSGSNMTS
jgi:hypothetical protein